MELAMPMHLFSGQKLLTNQAVFGKFLQSAQITKQSSRFYIEGLRTIIYTIITMLFQAVKRLSIYERKYATHMQVFL